MKKQQQKGCTREQVLALRDDDETAMAQSARVLGIHAKVRSASGNARKQFVKRHLNAAINIRRWMVLKTRHEELMRSNTLWSSLLYSKCTRWS